MRDAAIAAWNGDGPAHLSCGGNDRSPPMLINLHQVQVIKTEEITPAMRLGVDYDSMHQG